jgi:DNA-binding HxlR family transcriptional regulator
MPSFEFQGKSYNNPVELALDRIGGKWKMPIIWRLRERTMRYSELRDSLNAHAHKKVTHAMLTQQLRELERDGLLTRQAFATVPPRVDYTITPLGRRVIPVIDALRAFGTAYRQKAAKARP